MATMVTSELLTLGWDLAKAKQTPAARSSRASCPGI
jgi:hypothetical protein